MSVFPVSPRPDGITADEAFDLIGVLTDMRLYKTESDNTAEVWVRAIVRSCRTAAEWAQAAEKLFLTRRSSEFGLPMYADFIAAMPEEPTMEWFQVHNDDDKARVVRMTGRPSNYWRGMCGNLRPTDADVESIEVSYQGRTVTALRSHGPKELTA